MPRRWKTKNRGNLSIAYLSSLGNANIIPLATHRDPSNIWKNILRVYDAIVPGTFQDRDHYCGFALSKIYSILQANLEMVFEQWESWRYIGKSLAVLNDNRDINHDEFDQNNPDEKGLLRLNSPRYMLFSLENEQYALFDRLTYETTLISIELKQFLDQFSIEAQPLRNALQHPKMSRKALARLLQKKILLIESVN